jgi:hypothetical protein
MARISNNAPSGPKCLWSAFSISLGEEHGYCSDIPAFSNSSKMTCLNVGPILSKTSSNALRSFLQSAELDVD